MLPLPFAVCARPCATNAVLCTRDGQRFLPFARAPIELLPPHAFLNPTECEIECSNHRPRRLGEFRLMNAGDRRGPLGSHSFILGHTPRLTTSYCAVSGSPARSFKQLAPSTLAIAIGRRKAAVRFHAWRPRICFLLFRSTGIRIRRGARAHDGARGAAANPRTVATAKSDETTSRGRRVTRVPSRRQKQSMASPPSAPPPLLSIYIRLASMA